MIRELAVEIALRSYPAKLRQERGAEMVSTLLDASGDSRRRFAREWFDLLREGFRARALQTASAGAGRLIADGFCLCAILLMSVDLIILVIWRTGHFQHDPLVALWSIGLLAAALALALVGHDRLAGGLGLIWLVTRFPAVLHEEFWQPGSPGKATADHVLLVLYQSALPFACFAVLLLAPRRQAVDLRRLAWLALPVLLIVQDSPQQHGQGVTLAFLVQALALLLVVLFAAIMLPTDPRLAIALTLPLLGMLDTLGGETPTLLLLGVTAVVFGTTFTRNRTLRRRLRESPA